MVECLMLGLLLCLAVRDSAAVKVNVADACHAAESQLVESTHMEDVEMGGRRFEESTNIEITSHLISALSKKLHHKVITDLSFTGKIVLSWLKHPHIGCVETLRSNRGVGFGGTDLDLNMLVDLQGVHYPYGLPGCCWIDGAAAVYLKWPQFRIGFTDHENRTEYRAFVNPTDAEEWEIGISGWRGRTGILSHSLSLVQDPLLDLLNPLLPDFIINLMKSTIDQYANVWGVQTAVTVLTVVAPQDINWTSCTYVYEYQRGERGVPVPSNISGQ